MAKSNFLARVKSYFVQPLDLKTGLSAQGFPMGESFSGVNLTETQAMNVSVWWSCVRVLAETIGALPWAIYERQPNGDMRQVEHPLAEILMGSPNPYMTPQELKECQMVNLSTLGNSFSIIDRAPGGRVRAIYPVASDRGSVTLKDRQLIFLLNDRGQQREVPPEDVWHLKGFGGDGVSGLSTIANARHSLGLTAAAERYGARFFRDGISAGGILGFKEWLTPEQRRTADQRAREGWSNADNAHKIKIMEGGMTFTPLTINPEDAQLLLTRTFQTQEICRWFRVPQHMIGELSRSTFSNIEQQSQEFVTYTILPYLKRFEETATKRLFSVADRGKFVLKFNVEGLLRADSAARAALYSVMVDKGIYNRNEVRAKENLPRSEDANMDAFTVQSQMIPIDKIGVQPAPAPAPVTPVA